MTDGPQGLEVGEVHAVGAGDLELRVAGQHLDVGAQGRDRGAAGDQGADDRRDANGDAEHRGQRAPRSGAHRPEPEGLQDHRPPVASSSPSRSWSTRSARAATSRSWVAMTSAAPSSRRSSVIELEHVFAGGRVEVARRLVGHDQLGSVHQRARHGDALLFATRQLRGVVAAALAEAHAIEELADPVGIGATVERQRQTDVLFGGQVRHELEVLEYDSDLAPAQQCQIGLARRS